MRGFFNATATLIGAIIGAGIFGVPFVAARSGFAVVALWMAALTILVIIMHLFYAEVVIATPGKHRLPGYVDRYLGHPWKHLVAIASIFGSWGAQLAYIILGGQFLSLLINEQSAFLLSVLFFIAVFMSTFFGLWFIGRMEFFMTALLLLVVGLIIAVGFPSIQLANLSNYNMAEIVSPYGVILFSLLGALAIPEMYDLVKRDKRALKRSVVVGTVVAAIITFLFVLVVVGITGQDTTESALLGLQDKLNPFVLFLGIVFGFLAISTSYLVSGIYLTELFRYDYRLKHFPALIMGAGIPFLLFLASSRSFTRVIDVSGGIFGAFEAMVILLSAVVVFRRRQHLNLFNPKILVAVLAGFIFFIIMANKIIEVILSGGSTSSGG